MLVSYFPEVHWWWAPLYLGQPISRRLQVLMSWSAATPLFFSIISPGNLLWGRPHGNPCSSPMNADLGQRPFSWLCLLWCLISNATKWTITINQQSIPAATSSLPMVWCPLLLQGLCVNTLWGKKKCRKGLHDQQRFTKSYTLHSPEEAPLCRRLQGTDTCLMARFHLGFQFGLRFPYQFWTPLPYKDA